MLDPACPPLGDWGRNPTKSVLVVNNGPIDNNITNTPYLIDLTSKYKDSLNNVIQQQQDLSDRAIA